MKVFNRFHTYLYPEVLESFGTESVLNMASAEADCSQAGRCRLPAEWFYKDIKVRYVKVCIALKNLDNFIKAVRSCEPLHNTVNPVVSVSDLQQSPGHDCVGAVRYHIIQLARHWGLETFQMFDDSVPTSMLYQKRWNNPQGDQSMEFNAMLMTIKSMTSQDRFSNAALIGLTSTYSTKKLHNTSERYVINERTPTSCVFVRLVNVPDNLNYERRLPSKEDVIFAAQLIQAGKDVIINRHIHFKDYPFTVGGCIHNSPDEEAPAQEVEQLNIGN